jgi:hypothetical protein
MNRRRLRAILRTTIAASVPWTALGILIGVMIQPGRGAGVYMVLGRPVPGLVAACAIAGALVGIVNGLTFSGLVIAAEGGRSIEQLRGWRLATWGALATGSPVGLLFQSPLIAGIGAAMGAAGALAALRAARRAHLRLDSAAHDIRLPPAAPPWD